MIETTKKNFSVVKGMTRLVTALLVVACFVVLSSCGDDEKPANQIKVDGKTIKIKNAYMTSADDGDVSEHIVILTSSGVEVDSDGEISGTGDVVFFYLASEEATLVKGTYELTSSPDYGDLIFLEIGHTVNGNEPDSFYYGAKGNVKVTSVKDDKYSFKFDFTEVILSEDDEDTEIDATIKGQFSGKVEYFESSTARMAEKIKAFKLKK